MKRTTPDYDVVVVTFDTYAYSTRSRKAAIQYATRGLRTAFLGMSAAGRTGRREPAGSYAQDGVDIRITAMRQPATAPTRLNVLRNISVSYIPALTRIAATLVVSPSRTVHVTSAPLLPLGLLHKLIHRSTLTLDVTERPGAVSTHGSAFSAFARVETPLLRLLSRFVDRVSVVVPGDVQPMRRMGFQNVIIVRNAPLLNWRAPYVDPPEGRVRFSVIGSVFEGRGFETLLDAVSHARDAEFEVHIFGPGRSDYIAHLQTLALSSGAHHRVHWHGAIPPTAVSEAYLASHVGIVLYEPSNPGSDGLSNKILECVASGRPVLAGDLPENRRFVTENKVGWLSGVTEFELGARIREICSSRDQLQELARHCRGLGNSTINWENEFSAVADRAMPA